MNYLPVNIIYGTWPTWPGFFSKLTLQLQHFSNDHSRSPEVPGVGSAHLLPVPSSSAPGLRWSQVGRKGWAELSGAGAEQSRAEQSGIELSGACRSGAKRAGAEWCRAERAGTAALPAVWVLCPACTAEFFLLSLTEKVWRHFPCKARAWGCWHCQTWGCSAGREGGCLQHGKQRSPG